ncbi:MAG: mechanosensitive ion channel family protein [Cyanobacteriota bacterium]|nr:mechanosensitive ion channel family protein [Cyanobacteriota bacterium]
MGSGAQAAPSRRIGWIQRAGKRLAVCALALLVLVAPLHGRAEGPAEPASSPTLEQSEQQIDGFPVVLDGATVLVIRQGSAGFTAEQRAHTITRRLKRIAADPSLPIEHLTIQRDADDDLLVLGIGNEVLFTVSQRDAKASRLSQEALAEDTLQQFKSAINQYRQDRKPRQLIRNSFYALIASAAFMAICLAVIKASGTLFQAAGRRLAARLPSIQVKNVDVITSATLSSFGLQLLRLIRLILLLALFLAYATFLLRLFPWTRVVGDHALGYVLQSVELVLSAIGNYLPNLFVVAMIYGIVYYVLRVTKPFFTAIEKGSLVIPGFYTDWASPTYNLFKVLVIALAAILAFPYLPGFNSPAFQGVSVFLGLLLSLGSTSAITNVIGGIILIYTRAFRVGDHIRVGDVIGDIIEKNFLAIRICTPANQIITIPNSALLSNKVANYNISSRDLSRCLILQSTITLGYDVPWRKVHATLIEAALATEHILRDPAPFVLQPSLDNHYVTYQVNAYTSEPNQMVLIYSELHQHIQDKCNENGIEILSPAYAALRDGNRSTIPESYWPREYAAPPFRVDTTAQPMAQAHSPEHTSDPP